MLSDYLLGLRVSLMQCGHEGSVFVLSSTRPTGESELVFNG